MQLEVEMRRFKLKYSAESSYLTKLLLVSMSWFLLTGFLWDRPDPEAAKVVSNTIPIWGCADGQHYVIFGIYSTNPANVEIYALELGSNYSPLKDLEFEEQAVSKADSKNGLEKHYRWSYKVSNVPLRSAVIDPTPSILRVTQTWVMDDIWGEGTVKKVNGSWIVAFDHGIWRPFFAETREHFRSYEPWPTLLNNPSAGCGVFGL